MRAKSSAGPWLANKPHFVISGSDTRLPSLPPASSLCQQRMGVPVAYR